MATSAAPRRAWQLLAVPALAAVLGVTGALTVGKRPAGPSATHGGSPRPVRLQAAPFPATTDGSPTSAVALAPDGLAVVGTETGLVEVRGSDGEPIPGRTVHFANAAVIAIAVSYDGSRFAAATEKSAYVATRRSPRNGIVIPVFDESDTSRISTIALDARGRSLAVAEFGVDIFDVPTGRRIAELAMQDLPPGWYGGRGQYGSVGFTPDDTTVIASEYSQTESWSRSGWSPKSAYPCRCGSATLSSNARWASYSTPDGHLLLRDLAAGRTILDRTVATSPDSGVIDIAVSNDGNTLVGGSDAGEVIVWRASAKKPAGRLKIGDAGIGLVRLSANGRLAIAGEADDSTNQTGHKLWLVHLSDE